MEQEQSASVPGKPGSRVSLACVQCRSCHLRCDAVKPACSRCRNSASKCTYLKLRGGGRSNNAQSLLEMLSFPVSDSSSTSGLQNNLARRQEQNSNLVPDCSSMPQPLASGSSIVDVHSSANQSTGSKDALLELYYQYFHKAHPCVLPSRDLRQWLNEDIPGMHFLILVMQFIGSLYAPKECSVALEEQVTRAKAEQQPYATGFEVQALVLYSTAVYWCDERQRARRLLDQATPKAIALGMNSRNFAVEHSHGDPVLAESWRRTWWLLYIIDAHMAATDHTVTFSTSQKTVPCTVDFAVRR